MTTPEVKGTMPACVVGIVSLIYAVAMSLLLFFSIETMNIWNLLLLGVCLVTAVIGIGLLKLNYFSWLATTVFTTIKMMFGIGNLIVCFSHGDAAAASKIATEIGWSLVILYLLYRSRAACTRRFENFMPVAVVKRNLPALLAIAASCLALLIASFYGNGGMLLLFGLPLLALGSGVSYVIGLKVQKSFDWY